MRFNNPATAYSVESATGIIELFIEKYPCLNDSVRQAIDIGQFLAPANYM